MNITDARRMYIEIRQVGARALNAVYFAQGSDGLTPAAVRRAADWLEVGDRRAGVARPWPRLAMQLRRIANRYERRSCQRQQTSPWRAPSDV